MSKKLAKCRKHPWSVEPCFHCLMEERGLGRAMQYSRKIDWASRGRAMTGATALIAFWAYFWHTSSHGSPEYVIGFWMTIFSVVAMYCAIAETRRMDDEVDLVTPRRNLREAWRARSTPNPRGIGPSGWSR